MLIKIRKLPKLNWIFIFFLERVSKPKISWTCINTTLICEVMNGTDPELNLYQDGKHLKLSQRVITHKWTTNLSAKFKCTAGNKVSKESRVETVSCTGAWQASLHKHSSPGPQEAEARCSRSQVLMLGGSPGSGWSVKTYLFLLETFKGSLRGGGVLWLPILGVLPLSTIWPQAILKILF